MKTSFKTLVNGSDEYIGQNYSKEKILTVPDLSMSLAEIIERFTRNESLEIGFPVHFHESDDDLEKLVRLDPVDKTAYIKKMKAVQDAFNVQEKRKLEELEKKTRDEFIANVQKKERIKLKNKGPKDSLAKA